MKIIRIVLAIFFSIALAACGGGGGGGGGGGVQPPAANLSGTWSWTSVEGSNTCGTPVGTTMYWTGTASHAQGSNSFTLTASINMQTATFTGTISGNTVSLSGSYPDAGGTTTTSFQGTLNSTANPMSVSGTSSWTWTQGNSSCSGTTSESAIQTAGGALNVTTISLMPHNGSVTGTSDSYYRYTTIGAVSTISATGLTGDIDPKVYTDATFTTLSSNWSCTVNLGTASDSCTATTAVPAGTVLYIKARNYTSAGATFTLSVAGTAGALNVTTISLMPHNGSVTGTSDSYYRYTTIGAVSTISATGLTGDIDPKVYTDATFTTLSSNWSCTVNLGTASDSCTATTAVPAGTVLYIKARNYTSAGATFTLSVAGTAGGGTTLTTSFGNITGLTYNAALSNSGTTAPTTYSRIWTNTAGDMLDLIYQPSATEDILSVAFDSGANSYWAGTPTTNIICHVSGTNPLAWPTCASWGITVSRAAGTISFASTPAFHTTNYATGTMSGSFTFTAF